MVDIEYWEVQRAAALIVASGFLAAFVLALGFRHDRFRWFHAYLTLSVGLHACRVFTEVTTGALGEWWAAVTWANLAVVAILAVIVSVRAVIS